MKKFILFLFGILVFSASVYAQDGKKQMKQADKSISKFINDPIKNAAKLQEAIDYMNLAMEDDMVNTTAKAWNIKGKIYNASADSQVKANILDSSTKYTDPKAALTGYAAYKKALELATKKGDKKDALNGLIENEGHLNNIGIAMYTDQDYPQAYENFSAAIDVFKMLKANDKSSRLDEPEVYNDQIFFTAVAGYYGNKAMEVVPYLEEMRAATTDQPFVFEALYTAYQDSDMEKALAYLEEGRTLFPDDTGLLFAEINHYLKSNELDILIDKLKLALEKEPNNVSVYTTIGNVYDNLYTQSKEKGDMEKAGEYFDLSKDYYEQALAIDSNNFDANYSLGALYYNKAAEMTDDLNAFANDFSKEGTQKYNDLKAVMDGLFEQALPYFEKGESINMNDLNTLIALKEIYARKNMFDKSNSYKDRIDALKVAEQ